MPIPASKTLPASGSKADEAAGENAPSVDEGDSLDSEIETPEWKLDDIKVLEGKQTYLYSSDYMTDTYAHWAFLAEEGDDALTLVDKRARGISPVSAPHARGIAFEQAILLECRANRASLANRAGVGLVP